MKFRPILFSTEMVKAILEGSKTQTRRTKGLEIVNKNPDEYEFVRFYEGVAKFWQKDNALNENYIKCPYGQVGDVFWVRESCTWIMRQHAHDLLEGCRENTQWVYKASMHEDFMKYAKEKYTYKWKPSIHMPKEACRLFLRIKDIRVERLQDISEKDAIAEGAKHGRFYGIGQIGGSIREGYFELWERINGNQSVHKNSFVWVIEFERINKPENFK